MSKMLVAVLIGTVIAISSTSINAENTEHCISLEKVRGNSCGSPKSMDVRVTNKCPHPVYVKMCIQRTNGTWDCKSDSHLDARKTNTGFFTCHSTGKYEWSSCTGGYSECGFNKKVR